MRVVFDTNVLFAAFVAHGVCSGLYEECLLNGQIVVSSFILEELHDKLLQKAKLTRSEADEVIGAITMDAEVVAIEPLKKSVCRDPDDDFILATVLAARADALVTGDKDLLVLEQFAGVPILGPRDALALLRS